MPLILNSTPTPYSEVQNLSQVGFNVTLNNFCRVMRLVWKNTDPQGVINSMGTDAKNNFLASGATATYLATFSELTFPADAHAANMVKLQSAVALAWPYVVNADGTITATPPPAS